jgi:hypothetical protein
MNHVTAVDPRDLFTRLARELPPRFAATFLSSEAWLQPVITPSESRAAG